MSSPQLSAAYWTIAGPVEIQTGREWSLFDWRDRCEQAARVGFSGLGIWHSDLFHQLESRSLREMQQIFSDAGLRYLELEFLGDWFLDPTDPRRQEADRQRDILAEVAEALQAHHIKVGNIGGGPCERGLLVERFVELAGRVSSMTSSSVAYEFMPFDDNVQDIPTALSLAQAAPPGSSGIVIDTWHMSKLGIPPKALLDIPLDLLTWIELSDGVWESDYDSVTETTRHRRLPGEGEFDVVGYVEAAVEHGYRHPWGVEVLSDELRSLPIETMFDRAYATTSATVLAGMAAATRPVAATGGESQ